MRHLLPALAVCFTSANLCFGAFSKEDAGTATAQFLKLGAGARAAGLGNAYVALADDANAVYWNPAGMTQIDDQSASFTHTVWFEDIVYNWASYVRPLKEGKLGVGIQYLSYGKLDAFDEMGTQTGAFKPRDLAATVSYGNKIGGIPVGASVKYISSKIKTSASAFALDLGGMYQLYEDKFSVGLAIQNVGTKMTFVDDGEKLPANIKLGGAYKGREYLILAADLNMPVDGAINYGAGVEYKVFKNEDSCLAARLGYSSRANQTGGFSGTTVGFGFDYRGLYTDYAFASFGDLGATHWISLGINFGGTAAQKK